MRPLSFAFGQNLNYKSVLPDQPNQRNNLQVLAAHSRTLFWTASVAFGSIALHTGRCNDGGALHDRHRRECEEGRQL